MATIEPKWTINVSLEPEFGDEDRQVELVTTQTIENKEVTTLAKLNIEIETLEGQLKVLTDKKAKIIADTGLTTK